MSASVVGPATASHPWQPSWNPRLSSHAAASMIAVGQSTGSSRFDELLRAKLAAEQRAAASPHHSAPAMLDDTFAKLQRVDIPANVAFEKPDVVDEKPDINTLNAVNGPYYHYPNKSRTPSGLSDRQLQSLPMFGTPTSSSLGQEMYPPQTPGLPVPEQQRYWANAASAPAPPVGLPSPYEQAVLVKYGVIPASPAGHSPVKASTQQAASVQPPYSWALAPPFQVAPSAPPSLSGSLDTQPSISPVTPLLPNYPQSNMQVDVKPIISPLLPSAARIGDDHNPYASVNIVDPGNARYVSMSADNSGGLSSGNGLYNSSGHGSDGMGGGGLDGSHLHNGLDFHYGGGGDGHGGNGDGGDNQLPQQPPKPKKLPLACHFCRRRKLKCDGIKPSCDNCHKRGVDCSYDEAPRRRGPGKRTKEMRDRAAREARAAGLINNDPSLQSEHDGHIPADLAHHHHQHDVIEHHEHHHEHHQHHEHEHDHSTLMLDPALADDGGSGDLTDAMGALKRAGIELGLPEDGDLGEPSTLAEISELHAAATAEAESNESLKRKADFDVEEVKRFRLEEGVSDAGVPVIHGLDEHTAGVQ